MNRSFIGLFTLLTLTACGGGDAAPKPDSNSNSSTPAASNDSHEAAGDHAKGDDHAADAGAKSGGKQEWAASMGTATVSGKVSFATKSVEMPVIDMGADAKCDNAGCTEESIVVNDGGLANVVISVSKGLDGYTFADASGKIGIEQKGCQYIPHVIAMQAGQEIKITNDDDTVHNVHSYSKRNQSFNQAQPAGAAPLEKKMGRKDKMFPIKCDMHSWMNCFVVVFDHPFYTVSDANGNFTLPKLPAGTYTLTAEHESLGKQEATVTVDANGKASAEFSFKS